MLLKLDENLGRALTLICCKKPATLRTADGMPLIWASRLQRTPLPERVAGSDLIWSLTARAALPAGTALAARAAWGPRTALAARTAWGPRPALAPRTAWGPRPALAT